MLNWLRICLRTTYITLIRIKTDQQPRRFLMSEIDRGPSRRAMLILLTSVAGLPMLVMPATAEPLITVHKDPTCSCCTGWVRHLQRNGFAATVIETANPDPVKTRLGVPDELAACHTAETEGYAIEGHVPAGAIRRLLAEKPKATGLAVPGMPVGSPGMEGGEPETYDVILFGQGLRRNYMRFKGDVEL
jgi:hypothetical protein